MCLVYSVLVTFSKVIHERSRSNVFSFSSVFSTYELLYLQLVPESYAINFSSFHFLIHDKRKSFIQEEKYIYTLQTKSSQGVKPSPMTNAADTEISPMYQKCLEKLKYFMNF